MMIMLPEPRGQRGAASTVDTGTHCNLSICTSSTPTAYPEPQDVTWRVPCHVPCHVPWQLGVPQGRPLQQQREAAGAPGGGRGRWHQAQVGGPLKLTTQSPFRRRH